MTATALPGFDAFAAACRRRGVDWRPNPPLGGSGELGSDVELAALRSRCDGGRLWELDLAPRARVVTHNQMMRRGVGTLPVAHHLVVFASWHGLAWHLATVPALADAGGREPVVWVDLYDDGSVTPIASSVDRCFSLLAEHVERFGSNEPAFAGSVASSIAGDAHLLSMVRAETPTDGRAPGPRRRSRAVVQGAAGCAGAGLIRDHDPDSMSTATASRTPRCAGTPSTVARVMIPRR